MLLAMPLREISAGSSVHRHSMQVPVNRKIVIMLFFLNQKSSVNCRPSPLVRHITFGTGGRIPLPHKTAPSAPTKNLGLFFGCTVANKNLEFNPYGELFILENRSPTCKQQIDFLKPSRLVQALPLEPGKCCPGVTKPGQLRAVVSIGYWLTLSMAISTVWERRHSRGVQKWQH